MAEAVDIDRTLPHNLEAERSVLGAVLIHNDAFNQAAEVLTPRDFYRDAHRRIFEKMIQLSERGNAIDFITLKEELSRSGELDEVGGPAYVASLADGVPRATNVEYYARIVKEKSTLRNLIYAANKILTNAYEAEQDADLILDEAESAIFAVADDRMKGAFVPMRDLVKESFPKIEQLFEQKRLVTGTPTGFVDLDEMTRGFQAGDLVIIAARPSMGKTSLVLNVSQYVAMQPGMPQGAGSYADVPVVCLPGNPVSALTSFEVFLRPALRRAMGHPRPERPRLHLRLTEELTSPRGKRQFRRGRLDLDAGTVTLAGPPGSGFLGWFAKADCLVDIPADVTALPAGAEVTVWDLGAGSGVI